MLEIESRQVRRARLGREAANPVYRATHEAGNRAFRRTLRVDGKPKGRTRALRMSAHRRMGQHIMNVIFAVAAHRAQLRRAAIAYGLAADVLASIAANPNASASE
jgi:hypothetical protein